MDEEEREERVERGWVEGEKRRWEEVVREERELTGGWLSRLTESGLELPAKRDPHISPIRYCTIT